MLEQVTAAAARPQTGAADVVACVPFETTGSLAPTDTTIGHGRAHRALLFGARVGAPGHHVFAMGPAGIDRQRVVAGWLAPVAAERHVPDDWLYVQGFGDDRRPRALRLLAGQGRRLRRDLDALVDDLQGLAARILEDSSFQDSAQELAAGLEREQRGHLDAVREAAAADGLKLLQTPQGFALAPVRDDQVLEPEAFAALPEEEQTRIRAAIEQHSRELARRMQDLPARQRQVLARQRDLLAEHMAGTVHAALAPLRKRYQAWPEVLLHCNRLRDDVVEHAATIIAMHAEPGSTLAPKSPEGIAWQRFWDRYRANLLVDHADSSGAPVIHEANPSVEQLLGRQEHRTEFGSLVTDFTLIRAGALHRANGGFLLLDAERLLGRPFAWESLKRALQEQEIRLESTSQQFGLNSAQTLEPEPVPLDVKVILLGERRTWHLLGAHDPEFGALFRVTADFADHLGCAEEERCAYIGQVASLAQELGARPLDPDGMAAVLDHSRRLAGDRDRLHAPTEPIRDLLVEADDLAAGSDAGTLDGDTIRAAVLRMTERVDRIRSEVHARILDGTVYVATDGQAVGQVNGLAVLQAGPIAFGQPSRISATARLGRDGVLDIEREAGTGGSLHAKAVLIVQSFVAARYARELPLAVSASLVFEQAYGGVDGDSASIAEVCALLSAIAREPLRQNVAITGSMDQYGRAQAIGGVNEKVEGFHDICAARGFSGQQGCLVPAANVRHLMLRPDVADNIAQGRFHLWSMQHIDDALELLTGAAPGAPGADGCFPDGSLNARVAAELERFAERARQQRGDGESA